MKRLASTIPLVLLGLLTFGAEASGQNAGSEGVLLSEHPAQRAASVSGNTAPSISAPEQVEAVAGTGFTLSAEIVDADVGDHVTADAVTTLPGLTVESGVASPGKTILTVRGIVPRNVAAGEYVVTWTATDNSNFLTSRTTTIVTKRPVDSGADVESSVVDFVRHYYVHGMPENAARDLGPSAVGVLSRLLRDDSYKVQWCNIASALAIIGAPETFDTLQAFVWTRFRGEVDRHTFHAILCAHSNIWNLAATRSDVVDYLVRTANPEEWTEVSWRRPTGTMEGLAISFSAISINGLSCITTPRAIQALRNIQANPYLPQHAPNIEDGVARQERILRIGWAAYLQEARLRR